MNTTSFFSRAIVRIIAGKSVIIRERDSADSLLQRWRIIQKASEHFAYNRVNYGAALICTDATPRSTIIKYRWLNLITGQIIGGCARSVIIHRVNNDVERSNRSGSWRDPAATPIFLAPDAYYTNSRLSFVPGGAYRYKQACLQE